MNCPRCGAALDEALFCEPCQIAYELVESKLEVEEPLVSLGLVRDSALLPVLQSLLSAEGIRSMATNDASQDLIGWGRFISGFNPTIGAPQLVVRESDAEAARELLLHTWTPGVDEDLDAAEQATEQTASGVHSTE